MLTLTRRCLGRTVLFAIESSDHDRVAFMGCLQRGVLWTNA